MNRHNRRHPQKQQQTHLQIEQSSWGYPYPPPSILEQYPEEFKKILMNAFEQETTHRRKQESLTVSARVELTKAQAALINTESFERKTASLVFAAILLSILILGIYFLLNGKNIEGIITLLGTFGTVFFAGILKKKR